MVATATLLVLASPGTAARSAHTAFVPDQLHDAAAANRSAVFNVIVQAAPGKKAGAVAAAVQAERAATKGEAKGLKRQFLVVPSVSAQLTGAQVLGLSHRPGVLAITPDRAVAGTLLGPANLVPPTIAGTASDGEFLTATPGTWAGEPPLTFTYRWQRCDASGAACVDVVDATGVTYLVSIADVDTTLRVVVTAVSGMATATAASGPTALVPAVSPPVIVPPVAPANVDAPLITGDPVEGATLTAQPGTWTGDEPLVFTYQWLRCDADAGACSEIEGATSAEYVVSAADVDATLRTLVTATNPVAAETEASGATAKVSAAPAPLPVAPANTVAPAVTGTLEVGQTLTVAPGEWTGDAPISFAYRWLVCTADGTDCAPAEGAVSETYTIVESDAGKTIRAEVTATNAAGTAAVEAPAGDPVAALPELPPPPLPVPVPAPNNELWTAAAGVTSFWGAEPKPPAIAFVDSGIDTTLRDFAGRNVVQVTQTSLEPNSPGDGRGHGSFVASLAAGSAPGHFGVAPTADLVSVDVLDDTGRAMTSDVIAAADWIYQHKDEYNIRVATFSLHGTVATSLRFDPVDKAVEKLWVSGVVVVAAAGNYAVDGRQSNVRYAPGNDPFVITVGASDLNETAAPADDFAAPWSAYGYTPDGFAKPELGAPGRSLLGALPRNSTLAVERADREVAPGYYRLSGTSFATPIVAGAAAQVLARHPEWTPDQVKGALMETAQPTSTTGFALGVGVLDAEAAAAVETPPNPNAGIDRFLIPDPNGEPFLVFDAESWGSVATADPTWDAGTWSAESWGSVAWSAESWGSSYWSSESWGSESWGSESWGSESWGSNQVD